uniref:Uncharacterized protein n=1 Tax=OCS116 cluster bacterium TaxID=2030921 RepID=A0A2A4YTY7_9PROT
MASSIVRKVPAEHEPPSRLWQTPSGSDGLSQCFTSLNSNIAILVESDTGLGRCGVQSPQVAIELAKYIVSKNGVNFAGIMIQSLLVAHHLCAVQKSLNLQLVVSRFRTAPCSHLSNDLFKSQRAFST